MSMIILYASKTGTTMECARKLSEMTQNDGLINLRDDPSVDISSYSTVIIGTPIYMERVLNEVETFCNNNIEELLTKRVGIFTCGIGSEQEIYRALNKSLSSKLISNCIAKAYFGGEIKYERLNFILRFIVREKLRNLKKLPGIKEKRIMEFAKEMTMELEIK